MTKVTLITPLIITTYMTPLVLGEDIEIHAYQHFLDSVVKDARDKGILRQPFQFTHCLVVRNVDVSKDKLSEANEKLEEIVLRLRIYKAGSIGFCFAIVDSDGWYDKLLGAEVGTTIDIHYELIGVLFYIVWERPGLPSTYKIDHEDLQPLKSLFSITANKRLMDKPSFRYFFRGYHEPYATDRFLSNAIGLENLLVNDTKDLSNLTYKFIDRGCFLLTQAHPHPDGPEAYATTLNEIYKARSKVVHSTRKSKRDWNTPEEIAILRNSEDYLRLLLQYILHNPEMENSTNVDRVKRRKYE